MSEVIEMQDTPRKPGFLRAETRERPTGLNDEKHIIRGASIITRGEAKTKGYYFDDEFMDQVQALFEKKEGLKSRFDHPAACAVSMGYYLGEFKSPRRDGPRIRADLHLDPVAKESPHGDLMTYVEKLAEKNPENFGISIVWGPDWDATEKFSKEHQDKNGNFKSPDPSNVNNLPHARIKQLYAADVVDEPAANDGLYGLSSEATEASSFLDELFGFKTGAEALSSSLGVRAHEFLNSWQKSRGVKLVVIKNENKGETQMTLPESQKEQETSGQPQIDPNDETREIGTKPEGESEKPAESEKPKEGSDKGKQAEGQNKTPGLSNKRILELCEEHGASAIAKDLVDQQISENDVLASIFKAQQESKLDKPDQAGQKPLTGSNEYESNGDDANYSFGVSFAENLSSYKPEKKD